MRALLALVLLAALPTAAAALAALPQEETAGDGRETRVLLRVGPSSPVRVEADGAALVALVPPGETPGEWHTPPADLVPPPGEWHGLAGVVELVARREDPGTPVTLTVTQEESGVVWEWSARVPKPPAATPLSVAFAALASGVFAAVVLGVLLRLAQGLRRRRT